MGGTSSSSSSMIGPKPPDDLKRKPQRASKPDVLPQYFNLLKNEQTKKMEKAQRRISRLKKEQDEFEGAGISLNTEPGGKMKKKNWIMEIYSSLKQVYRRHDPHCEWIFKIKERLKKFQTFSSQKWKSDLFWQQYHAEARPSSYKSTNTNPSRTLSRTSVVSGQTILTTKDSDEPESYSISNELQAGRYTQVLEQKLAILRSHLSKSDHPICILLEQFETAFFDCYCQYLQSNEDLLRESISKLMILCSTLELEQGYKLFDNKAMINAYLRSQPDPTEAGTVSADIFCEMSELNFRKFIVELAIYDCQRFIEAMLRGFLAFYDIQLSASDISRDIFINELTNKVLRNNTYLLLFSLLSKANGDVIQRIEGVMADFKDISLKDLVSNPYFHFNAAFRNRIATELADVCLLPGKIEMEKQDLAEECLNQCIEIVRSVRDLESPYSKLSHFFKLNQSLISAIQGFWQALPDVPASKLQIDTESIQSIYLYLVVKSQYSKLWTEHELAQRFLITSLEFSNKSFFFTTLKLALEILETRQIQKLVGGNKEEKKEQEPFERAAELGSPNNTPNPMDEIFDIMMRPEDRRSTMTRGMSKKLKVKMSRELKKTMSKGSEQFSFFRNTVNAQDQSMGNSLLR